jgi:hypothetical protein
MIEKLNRDGTTTAGATPLTRHMRAAPEKNGVERIAQKSPPKPILGAILSSLQTMRDGDFSWGGFVWPGVWTGESAQDRRTPSTKS